MAGTATGFAPFRIPALPGFPLAGCAAFRTPGFDFPEDRLVAAFGCRVAVAGARRDLTFFMTRSSLWLRLLHEFGVNSVSPI